MGSYLYWDEVFDVLVGEDIYLINLFPYTNLEMSVW